MVGSGSGSGVEAGFVTAVLAALFFALYRGWYTPEVVVSYHTAAL